MLPRRPPEARWSDCSHAHGRGTDVVVHDALGHGHVGRPQPEARAKASKPPLHDDEAVSSILKGPAELVRVDLQLQESLVKALVKLKAKRRL